MPNLPRKRVTCVIVSGRDKKFCDLLKNRYGMNILIPDPLKLVQGSERYHADMIVCHIGRDRFFVSPGSAAIGKEIVKLGGDFRISGTILADHPLLNVCIVGKRLICDTNRAEKKIIEYFTKRGYDILHTKQRYARCSTVVIDSNSIISSDQSICRICSGAGMDVLEITPGKIHLEGYQYGFIGGCCGLIDKDRLLFCGNISEHPDYNAIKDFAQAHGVELEFQEDSPLTDIGGILPVMEKSLS